MHRNPGEKEYAIFWIFGGGKFKNQFGFSPKTGKG
jgi:hypothetical protein